MPVDGIGVVANTVISPSADYVAIKYDSYELYNNAYNYEILFMVLGWYVTSIQNELIHGTRFQILRISNFLNSIAQNYTI